MKSDLLTSKKKCKTLKIIAIVLLVILTCAALFSVAAVAFDANDYSSSSSSSSSSDDDDGDGLFFLLYLIFELIPFPWNIIIAIVVIIIFISVKSKGKKIPENPSAPTVAQAGAQNKTQLLSLPNRNGKVLAAVQQFDSEFNGANMVALAKSTFISVQTAWCNRNMEPVRGLMSTNQYNTVKRQVQAKIDQGVTYHYEDITIPEAWLTSYVRDKEFEYVTVYVHASYIDYQVDDKTGNIIRGNRSTHWHIGFKMKFMRKISTSSAHIEGKTCPNCGAPIFITSSAKCEYCGTVITNASEEWVLSDFMSVRSDTTDEGIRS